MMKKKKKGYILVSYVHSGKSSFDDTHQRVVSLLGPKEPSSCQGIDLSFLGDDDVYVACSCVGLLCFRTIYGIGGAIFLYNPTTNESRRLPKSDYASLGFSGTVDICLGFDLKSRDYKVVRFPTQRLYRSSDDQCRPLVLGCELYSASMKQMELYSLKDDRWRKISYTPLDSLESECVQFVGMCSTYVNGYLYWIAMVYPASKYFVVSLNLADETISRLPFPLPHKRIPDRHEYLLVDYKGSLGIILYPSYLCGESFKLWVFVDGSKWTKVFDVSLPGVERPLGFSKNGNLLFLRKKSSCSELPIQLLVYDFETKQLGKTQSYDLTTSRGKSTVYRVQNQFIPFVESTVSLIDGFPKEEEVEELLPAYYNGIRVEQPYSFGWWIWRWIILSLPVIIPLFIYLFS